MSHLHIEHALLILAQDIVFHSIFIEHLDEVGKSLPSAVHTSSHDGLVPSTIGVRSTHPKPIYEPHECTSCALPCNGLALPFDGFLSDVCIYGQL